MEKIILLLLCISIISACGGNNSETKINMPSAQTAIENEATVTEKVSVIGSESDILKEKKPMISNMPEPVIRDTGYDRDVIDGMRTINARNICFIAVKIGDSKYAVYTLNGVELSDFHMVDDGAYLLDIYDFQENNLICCTGDATFLSGGIAGFDNVPSLTKIENRMPITIKDITDSCVWIKDFDKDIKYKHGVWKAVKDGADYIITSFRDDEDKRNYYITITDKCLSMYTEWDNIVQKFA